MTFISCSCFIIMTFLYCELRMLRVDFKKIDVFILKSSFREIGHRKRSTFYSLIHSPDSCNGYGWPGQSQDPGASFVSSMLVTWIQMFGPSSAAFPRPKVGSWIGPVAARTWSSAHMQCHCHGSSFSCCNIGLESGHVREKASITYDGTYSIS